MKKIISLIIAIFAAFILYAQSDISVLKIESDTGGYNVRLGIILIMVYVIKRLLYYNKLQLYYCAICGGQDNTL